MRTRTNAICAACASAHDTLNRRYCLKLQRGVEADVLPLCEKWLPVPGFPLYVVGELSGRVLSRARGPWRERRARQNNIIRLLEKPGGATADFTRQRILFAARRGVDPRDRAFAGFIVTRDGVLTSRADLTASMKANSRKYASLEKTLTEAGQMIGLLLEALRGGDFSKVADHLYGMKDRAMAYMARNEIAYCRDSREELFAEAVETVLSGVVNGRCAPVLPEGYLMRTIRNLYRRQAAERRKLRAAAQDGDFPGT